MAKEKTEKKTRKSDRFVKKPLLYIFYEDDVKVFELAGIQYFGRKTKSYVPDLYSDALTVSRRHGVFRTYGDVVVFTDTGSSNGTTINDQKLEPMKPERVGDGSVLRIHAKNSAVSLHDIVMVVTTDNPEDTGWTNIPLEPEMRTLEVGRGKDISLRGRTASRNHASFVCAQNGWALVDNNSLNGVQLNGQQIVNPVLLRPMDVIRIAKHLFVFRGNYILFQEDKAPSLQNKWDNISPDTKKEWNLPEDKEEKQTRDSVPEVMTSEKSVSEIEIQKKNLSAADKKSLIISIREKVVWNRLRKKTILRDVNLCIDSGSLVLILGGSGAGKTTFMNAVMGYEPAKGKIVYGSSDIYREFEKMKYEIGYVPQQDLLRMDDVVYDTLDNAARMRLPDTMTEEQREQRVQYTLYMFGLIREKDSIVGKLSGGQRKRLSIAVEYIGNPSLFFLDEPDSGLDGIMAKELMTNLRQIADQGKIVMVISHSPDRAFELFDKIIVLAKSAKDDCGHLVFFGTPGETCRFFETKTLEQVVGRINRKDEGGDGMADYFMQKYHSQRHVSGG